MACQWAFCFVIDEITIIMRSHMRAPTHIDTQARTHTNTLRHTYTHKCKDYTTTWKNSSEQSVRTYQEMEEQ